jgi:hypothetical protein
MGEEFEKEHDIFWNTGGSSFGKEYLRDLIKDNDNKLFDDFIDDDVLDSFWKEQIDYYKLTRILDTLKIKDVPDYKPKHDKNQIIHLWERYKLSHGGDILFEEMEAEGPLFPVPRKI